MDPNIGTDKPGNEKTFSVVAVTHIGALDPLASLLFAARYEFSPNTIPRTTLKPLATRTKDCCNPGVGKGIPGPTAPGVDSALAATFARNEPSAINEPWVITALCPEVSGAVLAAIGVTDADNATGSAIIVGLFATRSRPGTSNP